MRSDCSILVELFHFRDELWTFIATPELTEPRVAEVSLTRSEVDDLINEMPQMLSSEGSFGPAWKRISDLISSQLRPYLGDGTRVVFVPHRIFHVLPLHLLIFDGKPLIVSHAVAYAASASVLAYCRSRNPKRLNPEFRATSVAAIAVDFEDEPAIVARYFDETEIVLGSSQEITTSVIQASVRDKDVVHFSAHGRFVVGDADQSGLMLSESRVLTLRDVYRLQLSSYLVVLGACVSAFGDYVTGDEVVGLTRGFLYAGTPTVVGSLWPVPDAATMMLMDRFYSSLLGDGLDKADALRAAQLAVRAELPMIAAWGGFIMIGDWI